LLTKNLGTVDAEGNITGGLFSEGVTAGMERADLFYDRIETNGRPVVFMPMGSDNVEKIINGTKTTTLRSKGAADKIGLKPGETGIVNIKGELFEVTNRGPQTIQEAGGLEAVVISEGFPTVPHKGTEGSFKIETNSGPYFTKFPHVQKWLQGKIKTLNVYDIKPATNAEIKPSLATRINEFLKVQAGKNNPLIRLLETDIDPTGKNPSLILFNAASAENLDEGEMHSALVDLLESKDPYLVAIGQDLINYTLLSGGVQGATNILKYIPPAYLNELGISKALREFTQNLIILIYSVLWRLNLVVKIMLVL